MGFRRLILVLAAVLVSAPESAPSQFAFSYDPSAQQWDLSNGLIRSIFRVTPDSRFTLVELDDISSGQSWRAAEGEASSPISVRLGSMNYDAATLVRLVEQHVETPDANTQRQVILLEDLGRSAQIRLQLEMYAGQPVLRHQVSITNLQFKPQFATAANLEPYSFAADAPSYQMFRVAQWAAGKHAQDFGTSQATLDPAGAPTGLLAGSGGLYCTWMAVRDPSGHGLFAGWEFDGQSAASVRHRAADGLLNLSAAIVNLHHPVEAGDTFTLPAGFVGVFQGNWDQAGFATQKFAEAALARPAPANFPYVAWDSWGYTTGINEDLLRRNADAAAAAGAELFLVDLGWALQIGDWVEDPAKFPSGMRALSDYVHARGMKFGLHFALAEAMSNSLVLQQHSDWAASVSDNYFGAQSLCLANKPTRDWVVAQAVRMIDDYNLDYILQDGQNMVKKCTRTDHTHDALDSNYANAVEGIDAVVEEVERQRPSVLWENCENGGNMMTFSMLRHYVTSITNDASGALGSRQGVWGATYPFPPRYADRYMPEDPASPYITRSYMFGGPWHFMNRLAEMDPGMLPFAQSEVQTYKQMRAHVMNGQVFHLTSAPGVGRTDALESYTASGDSAVVVVTRDQSASASAVLKLQGLSAGQTYRVRFKDDRHIFTMTGQQLMQDGVRVHLPESESAEIVFVEPLSR